MPSTACAPHSFRPLAIHSYPHCGGLLGHLLTLVSGGPVGPPLSGMGAPTLAFGRCGAPLCTVVTSVSGCPLSGGVVRTRPLAEVSPALQSLHAVASSGPVTASVGLWAMVRLVGRRVRQSLGSPARFTPRQTLRLSLGGTTCLRLSSLGLWPCFLLRALPLAGAPGSHTVPARGQTRRRVDAERGGHRKSARGRPDAWPALFGNKCVRRATLC